MPPELRATSALPGRDAACDQVSHAERFGNVAVERGRLEDAPRLFHAETGALNPEARLLHAAASERASRWAELFERTRLLDELPLLGGSANGGARRRILAGERAANRSHVGC